MTSTRRAAAALGAAALVLAGCGNGGGDGRLKVGYVVNFMSHEWYQNICKAARDRAAELGVDLVIADANLDVAAQVSKAETMIAQGVKVLILTPVDARALGAVVESAKRRGIHVLTESNPVAGALSCVGIDNEAAGRKAGAWLADYARRRQLAPQILIVGFPNFEDCRLRVAGFKQGLAASGIDYRIAQEVDGQGLKERAFKVAQDALAAHPEIDAIFGINDDSATGGMAAYRAAGLDGGALTAIGFGFEGSVGRSALLGDTGYRAALAMFPEFVGVSLVEAAVAAAAGRPLPALYETPTLMVTGDNFADFYQPVGGDYALRLDAVRRLMP